MFQHYVFSSDKAYLYSYLARGDASDFLQRKYSSVWEQRIAGAAGLLKSMHATVASAGARLVILLIPQRVQASMISHTDLPQRLDPNALAGRLQLAIGEDMHLLNFLETLRAHPKPSSLYFPVDGHLTKEGHQLLGTALADYALSSGLLD